MIVESLVADIRLFRPVFIMLLATSQSEPTARRMIDMLEFSPENYQIVTLHNAHDLRGIFQTAKDGIRHLIKRGFEPRRISINYSSGTKVMSTGLVLAALTQRCEMLRYNKHSENTVERKSSYTSPRVVFAYHHLLEALHFFEQLRFQSTKDSIDRIEQDLLDDADIIVLDELRILTSAFADWDNFRFTEALEQLKGIEGQGYLTARFFPKTSQLESLNAMADSVGERRYNEMLFADVFNNALRRYHSARYDDAIIRAYRALEMQAQFILHDQFGIDTDRVDTRKVPPKYRPDFDALRSMDDGLVRIGLRKSYELLRLLEHPLGQTFCAHPGLKEMMETRGRSFLSHGVQPMSREQALDFIRFTGDVCRAMIPRFEELCAELQFTWLERENDVWNIPRKDEVTKNGA
ncbi:TIGR02710 family CRISPR-associated protein [Candidatus Sumerlaeota bacterium]|nr:TIGR02710 family CRISPR-associated protein [Candidatus Sumerlaeota bacterium]